MTWHTNDELLARYVDDRLDDARALSVEAHLLACEACRAAVADHLDAEPLERVWDAVVAEIVAPVPGPVERLLRRLGVRDHLARLLAATPSLQLSWFAALTVALGFAVVAAHARPGPWGAWPFLVLAPLVPVAGVAATYGPAMDPTHEIGVAAPMHSFRLLLVRAVAVLATSLPLTGLVALALPGLHWTAAAWLLPALALTLATLATSTVVAPLAAAGSVTFTWLAVVSASVHLAETRLALFGPFGQLAFVVVAAIAVAVPAVRHHRFETLQDEL